MTRKIFSCIIHSQKAPYATCGPSSYFIFLLMTVHHFSLTREYLIFSRENLSKLHLIMKLSIVLLMIYLYLLVNLHENELQIFLNSILFSICIIQHSKDGTFSAHVFWLNEHSRKENYLIIMPLIFESATCWFFCILSHLLEKKIYQINFPEEEKAYPWL